MIELATHARPMIEVQVDSAPEGTLKMALDFVVEPVVMGVVTLLKTFPSISDQVFASMSKAWPAISSK